MNNLPTDAELSSASLFGKDLLAAEKRVLDDTARLKKSTKVRDDLRHVTGPDLFEEFGIEQLTMTGGREVSVKPYLTVQPLKADRPLVLAALVEQGAGALIKTTLSIPFARGQDAEVRRINEMLQQEGLTTKVDIKVESSTLKKHVKERLEAGEYVDQKLFGVRSGRIAKFSKGAPKADHFEE